MVMNYVDADRNTHDVSVTARHTGKTHYYNNNNNYYYFFQLLPLQQQLLLLLLPLVHLLSLQLNSTLPLTLMQFLFLQQLLG
jgi:hypothetical protein